MINPALLMSELKNAGLPVNGCASNGRVDWEKEPTEAQKKLAAEVIAKHNPTPPTEQRKIAYTSAGITLEKMIVALWEKEVEGRPEAAAALQALREQVKSQIPTEKVAS